MTDQPIVPVVVPAVEPKTPAEAAAKLKELTGSAEWSKAWLAGDGPKAAEFNRLQELASNYKAENPIFLDPAKRDAEATTAFLRGAGIDDPAVLKQVLSGEEVSQAEFDTAKSARARLMRDHDFQKKYLSGDGEAVRTMTLLNVILTRDVKKGAAA